MNVKTNFKFTEVLKILILFVLISNFTLASDIYSPKLLVEKLEKPAPGYLFIAGVQGGLGIMDAYGNSIDSNSLNTIGKGINLQLQSNGYLTYFNSSQKKFYALNNKYELIDSFTVPKEYSTDFHEFILNSDGSYFLIGKNVVTVDMSKIVSGGSKNASVVGMTVFEFDKNKNEIWKWDSRDHFSILDVTSDIDLTLSNFDFCHMNSIAKDLDGNIIISSRHLDEITKINYKDGKIIWRMGGQNCKNNQFAFINDYDSLNSYIGFSHQHSVSVLSNGNLLLIDNGNLKSNPFTRAVEYKVDEINKTVAKVWEFIPKDRFYLDAMGNSQRLENGNTLICLSSRIYEVDKSNKLVYYSNLANSNLTYRAYKSIVNMSSVNKTITKLGEYDFNNELNQTGIKLIVEGLKSSCISSISKHNYKPSEVVFVVALPTKILNCRWVVSNDIDSVYGKIKINTLTLSDFESTESYSIYQRDGENLGLFKKLTTTYDNSNNSLEADISNDGEFIIGNNSFLPSNTPILKFPYNNNLYLGTTPINWKESIGATNYEVQVSTNSQFNSLVKDTVLTYTSYNFVNFDLNSTYYWKVKAINKNYGFESPWSEVWSFRTFIETPSLVEPINNAKNVSNKNGKLKWNKVKNALSYMLEISNSPLFNDSKVFAIELKDTSYYYQLIDSYTNYSWRVNAINGDGKTSWSKVNQFKTAIAKPILKLPLNKSTGLELNSTLDFIKPIEADYFQYEISKLSDFSQIDFNNIIYKNQNANYSDLASYTKYFWRVRSIHDNDTSAWSEKYSFITRSIIPKLLYPNDNAINEMQNLTLFCENIKGQLSYEVYLAESSNFQNCKTYTNKLNRVNIADLKPNQIYFWKAKAIYSDEMFEWSKVFKFTTAPIATLERPSLILPEDKTVIATNLEIKWLKVKNADKFRLQISKSNEFEYLLIDTILQDYKFLVSNLENKAEYFIRLQSQNIKEVSEWSEKVDFVTGDTTVLNFPKSIEPKDNDVVRHDKVQFVWDKVYNADKYNLVISESYDFNKNKRAIDNIIDTTIVIDFDEQITYYWTLQSINNKSSKSLISPINSFTIKNTSGIITDLNESFFSVYPNPVDNLLNIRLNEPLFNANISIKDLTGKMIKSFFYKENINGFISLSCDYLVSGMYLLEISFGSEKHSLYFIKN
ncbi:MAG: aryl-sulfate sulfotransferase [Candidatus Kapabacteria bacterium]|nr:aryl-sulfate sulfotransferase [Candidatus Kapabacteria bacterium]